MIPIQDNTPRRCPPIMTWTLIAINLTVFLIEIQLPQPVLKYVFYLFGLVPERYANISWNSAILHNWAVLWPFLTCMFLHGGWIHVLANMWTLWIFGDNVEDEMGPFKFLAFYLLSGIAASLIQILTNPLSTVPTIGASGAIAGVMGAYYILFPRARIVLMVPLFFIPFFFEVPAFFYLAIWFLEQFFSGTLSLASSTFESNIAWWAHVGGFSFGVFLHRLFLGRRQRPCVRFTDEYRTFGMMTPRDRI